MADQEKILIVDDDKVTTEVLRQELQKQNYEVISAEDGQTGLEMAQKEMPDLVILDLMMPKMTGYKVCGLLKQNSTTVTFVPRRQKACAISTPIGPPPKTIKEAGNFSNEKISTFVT